ncbi:hypothetical protein [Streptomyces sp. NPDC003077]|uniref:hypothetical protein n=1 Tax=Streptomyces sp. NPDC003077 TaxID=3154443 RepID=UPI0033A2BC20
MARPRAVRRNSFYKSVAEVVPDAIVFDRDYEMVATVAGTEGIFVLLRRPTGFEWRAHYRRVRPATDYEERQLVALARLHKQRLRCL